MRAITPEQADVAKLSSRLLINLERMTNAVIDLDSLDSLDSLCDARQSPLS